MEYNSTLSYQDILEGKIDLMDINWKKNSEVMFGNSTGIKVIPESKEHFMQYLKRLNFGLESDMLVLPADHHYFYDERELKNVKTLVNLRKLNQMKHPGRFLYTLFNVLPHDANFIGCFSDDKKRKHNGGHYYKPSRLLNRFINFIDSRADQIMDKNEVSELLRTHGFKLINMTEIGGITYFYSQNIRSKTKQRA